MTREEWNVESNDGQPAAFMWALSDALGDKVSGTLTYKERHRNRAIGHTFDIRELDIHCWRNN